LRKNRQSCHPEEAKPTKDLCICLKIQIQGSFASLRMTASERFSAASSGGNKLLKVRCRPEGRRYDKQSLPELSHRL